MPCAKVGKERMRSANAITNNDVSRQVPGKDMYMLVFQLSSRSLCTFFRSLRIVDGACQS